MTILAQGAEELLIALATPSPRGNLGVPILLWGEPGAGKTSFVESLARDHFLVTTLIASIHDPTDFSGLPLHVDGRTQFAPPEWAWGFDDARGGILFLDELTTAPPSVQAALLRVVLERRVGFRSLPNHVRIVAAANPPSNLAGGWELSSPLANRFVHLEWQLSGIDFARSLEVGFARPELPAVDPIEHRDQVSYWRMLTQAFLRTSPSMAYTKPGDGEYAFASPRTWDYAIHLMATCDLLGKAYHPGQDAEDGKAFSSTYGAFLSLVRGSVGGGATRALLGFLRGLNIPDPQSVLDGTIEVQIGSLKDDELYVLFTSLAAYLARREERPDKLVDSMLRLLTLFDGVNQAKRVDAVFAPVRQIVHGQLIQRAVAAAHRKNRLVELNRCLERVFGDTPLADYINVLGSVE